MRVVAGTLKGRKILAVPNIGTRPVLDRVRTALFDILRPRISGTTVLDLFGGSGSLSIEAISQGASTATLLDISKPAIDTIRQNVTTLGIKEQCTVRKMDAFSFLRNSPRGFDLVFVAPPQYKGLWIEAMQLLAERPSLVNEKGLIVVQIDPKEYEALALESFVESDSRTYGNTMILFYEKIDHKVTSVGEIEEKE